MGCAASSSIFVDERDRSATASYSRYWRVVPTQLQAQKCYSADGTLPSDSNNSQLEFRTLLDYPIAQQYLSDYIVTISPAMEINFKGWLDIQIYNKLHEGSMKTSLAQSIYHKFIDRNVFLRVTHQQEVWDKINALPLQANGLFDTIQAEFFMYLHDDVFVKFKQQDEYKNMVDALRRKYNRVKISDFDYFDVLGQGGFGLVVKAKKKSTGICYAMKIQRKDALYEIYSDEPWRVDFEKQAFASCKHPFITELSFAFQTKSLAILVMSLGTGDDLGKILKRGGPIPYEQVLFYSAEITCALSYLHHKGFVYRDLKPGNVLLNADGHIQLVDMGGVTDIKGKTLGLCNDSNALLPVFARHQVADDLLPLSRYWSQSHQQQLPNHPLRADSHNSNTDTWSHNPETIGASGLFDQSGTYTRSSLNNVVPTTSVVGWTSPSTRPSASVSGSGSCADAGRPSASTGVNKSLNHSQSVDIEIVSENCSFRPTCAIDVESEGQVVVEAGIVREGTVTGGLGAVNGSLKKEMRLRDCKEGNDNGNANGNGCSEYPLSPVTAVSSTTVQMQGGHSHGHPTGCFSIKTIATDLRGASSYSKAEEEEEEEEEEGDGDGDGGHGYGNGNGHESPRCAVSLVGTHGYMAPEMLVLMIGEDEGAWRPEGYTKAVDWWSLGVTMYKLLEGSYPFETAFKKVTEDASSETRREVGQLRYEAMFEELVFTRLDSHPDAVSIISRLLTVVDRRRLGYGPTGSQDVSSHRYFRSIDWVNLEKKQLVPPPLPKGFARKPESQQKVALSQLLSAAGKADWVRPIDANSAMARLNAKDTQSQFEYWDYTAPAAVMQELGHTL